MAQTQSTFIFLEADTFDAQAREAAKKRRTALLDEKSSTSPETVRRPYRGIQIKDDVYATLSIRKANGESIKLTSSSAKTSSFLQQYRGSVDDYSDFILQRIEDQRMEKQQIIETFGEPFVYFFGERPRMITFSGLLINTEDFNWRAQFWENYDKQMRGTKLVEQNARCYLVYDTILIEGYPLTASAQDMAEMPYQIPFQMQMFVTAYYDFSSIGKTLYPGVGSTSAESLDVANRELDLQRGDYVSTTLAVRAKNLTSLGAGGILAQLRSGIKKANAMVGIAGNYLQKAQQFMGGRIVRVPLGIAGALANTGEPEFAAGSAPALGTSNELSASFDRRTAVLTGVLSVKVRAPKPAGYAPSWVSPVTGKTRGHFWENVDEYPTRKETTNILDIFTKPDSVVEAELRRSQARAQYEAALLKFAETDKEGSSDVADTVNMVKANFGILMNAKAFVVDPATTTQQVLGLDKPVGVAEEFAKRGIRIGPDGVQLTKTAAMFIGKDAAMAFATTVRAIESGQESGTGLGDAYQAGAYRQDPLSKDTGYEDVYGDNDHTDLISSNPEVKGSLSETYGDTDSPASVSEISPEAFSTTYGTGGITTISPSVSQRAVVAQQAQAGLSPVTDEDSTGIISVGDAGADIESVI